MPLIKYKVPALDANNKGTPQIAGNSTYLAYPGVHGDPVEMVELIKVLSLLNGPENDFFIHGKQDRVHQLTAKNPPPAMSLEETAAADNAALKAERAYGPYIVIGYSFGCSEAFVTANKLAHAGEKVFLYLIDGATPHLTCDYFNKNSSKALWDLIDIIETAARMHGLKDQYHFTPDDDAELRALTLNERIDQIAQCIIDAQRNIHSGNIELFKARVCLIKENFNKLIEYKKNNPDEQVNSNISIHALTIKATAEKYGQINGGWDAYGLPFDAIENEKLSTIPHNKLLKDASALIGEEISKSVKAKVISDPTTKLLQQVVRQLAEDGKLLSSVECQDPALMAATRLLFTARDILEAAKVRRNISPSSSPTAPVAIENPENKAITHSPNRHFSAPGSPALFSVSPKNKSPQRNETVLASPAIAITSAEETPSQSSFSDESDLGSRYGESGTLTGDVSRPRSGNVTPLQLEETERERGIYSISPVRA